MDLALVLIVGRIVWRHAGGRCGCRKVAITPIGKGTMLYVICLLIAVALTAYLLVAMLKPELF